jgi:UDP-4-amino-4,6-dideoxy-N-acetyl-beta-L-altrosamine N-acetyltransferase
MIKNYEFKKLTEKDLLKVLSLRNRKKIRDISFTKHIISIGEHRKWFSNKINNPFFNHYLLKHNNKIVGVSYGENYNAKNKSCLWGFYLDTQANPKMKYGSIIKYLIVEKLFSIKKVEKLESQVLKNVAWIKDWHLRWGNKLKNFDKDMNCYNLYLLKKDWQKIRKEMKKKLI